MRLVDMKPAFSPPIFIRVNYLEQGQSLDEICKKAVDWGFDGVEFRHESSLYGSPICYLDQVRAAVDTSRLKQVSFGFPGPDLMLSDAAAREKKVVSYIRFLNEIADRFTLGTINTAAGAILNPTQDVDPSAFHLHGSSVASGEHWEQAALGFQEIAAVCEGRGIRLAFELHPYYLHDLPRPTLRLIQAIGSPAIGANLDYGNVIYYPDHPSLEDSLALLKDHLFLVHLKNSLVYGEHRQTVGLQEGEINHRQFLRLLRDHSYRGALCIEAPRVGDARALQRLIFFT